jgi:hypothetical protein
MGANNKDLMNRVFAESQRQGLVDPKITNPEDVPTLTWTVWYREIKVAFSRPVRLTVGEIGKEPAIVAYPGANDSELVEIVNYYLTQN